MVFRKPKRPHFYCWPTLPGFGRVGPWSTGATSKRLAEAVEAWLRQTALSDPESIRAIVSGHYTLREAYVASQEGRLGDMKANVTDRPLATALREYRLTQEDRRKLDGLTQLEALIPSGARLSWLADSKNITHLLVRSRAAGRKTNSVHRSLYAGIKGLLSFEFGETKKLAITADVQFTYEDDKRFIDVTPEQIAVLLQHCDAELYDIAVAAMLTGVDQGPLLRLTPASFDFGKQTVRVHDTKAASRQRVLEISDVAAAHFRRIANGTPSPNALLFRLTTGQITSRWKKARELAGLDTLRFKDLRHVFSNAWVDEGGSLHALGNVLGHSRATTTLRYTARQARAEGKRMEKVASRLGLKNHHVRLVVGE